MALFLLVVFCAGALPLLLGFLTWVGRRSNRRTSAKVAAIMDKHIQGTEGPWDWDYFTARPSANDRLDAILARCAELDDVSPTETRQELEEILQRLGKMRSSA